MRLTLADVRRFVDADSGLAVVSFARPDGTVHSSLVNAGVMPHPVTGVGSVALVIRDNTVKLRHWRARPGAGATLVFKSGWSWIGVEGPISVIGPEDPYEGFDPGQVPRLLREVFVSAGGTHDDWDEYDRVMAEEGRTAVFVEPRRITGSGTGVS
ncbi:MAG: pyridoxamine 5'-phosphate oxidase [Acidimicrobiia bacterium]|nr:pyridoxamine 5'-phosphate oxidase [bacterium]MXZ06479.1 pyridoxamine 5'-phosphate oxidase [Acidimicrobiia bacterium]MYF25933.1 pyridoxamine 5'-phosphate oxidase [Acidimicrobiia bacterium]MYH55176.1 pyridoxamine 5'-phosphate oxidase [Acidimicrobiia bacterium]